MTPFFSILVIVTRALAIAATIIKAQETLIEGSLTASLWVATGAILVLLMAFDVVAWGRQQARQCAWPRCQHPSSHHDEWGCAICRCGEYRRSLND